ncbi:hypothetical protein [Pseudomonas orientalis]|uniref:hypothetical protein n=1 Tax=Pseudomonas orientalis TaxID=76758 RepID=UPI000F56A954|nr:hypothetical protein [Pseudomonas orientalis]
MKEINTQFNSSALGPSINNDPLPSKTTIKNVDEARGYVAALGLRYQDQFSAASSGLAEKVSKGQLDEDSYLLLTSAMVDASRMALAR